MTSKLGKTLNPATQPAGGAGSINAKCYIISPTQFSAGKIFTIRDKRNALQQKRSQLEFMKRRIITLTEEIEALQRQITQQEKELTPWP